MPDKAHHIELPTKDSDLYFDITVESVYESKIHQIGESRVVRVSVVQKSRSNPSLVMYPAGGGFIRRNFFFAFPKGEK